MKSPDAIRRAGETLTRKPRHAILGPKENILRTLTRSKHALTTLRTDRASRQATFAGKPEIEDFPS
jgi:hypothetical protein